MSTPVAPPPTADSPVDGPSDAPVADPTEAPVADPTEAPDVPTEKPVANPTDDVSSDAPSLPDVAAAPSPEPTPVPTVNAPSASPAESPTLEAPTTMAPYPPIPDPGMSYAPHKRTFVETAGTMEKTAADDLSPAEIFGITVAVLVLVCILGFCFGRRFALWCHKRRTQERQPTSADEAAPFSPAEQDML
ncbi:hypothetical protein MHU86_7910 [Fragilaria crotonensis]|nr:hypothetical protein MHU86_7910 [Fragilaria crotonensis]